MSNQWHVIRLVDNTMSHPLYSVWECCSNCGQIVEHSQLFLGVSKLEQTVKIQGVLGLGITPHCKTLIFQHATSYHKCFNQLSCEKTLK